MHLPSSELAEMRPVAIHYEVAGKGRPLVFLHGGWGYDVYPIDLATMAQHWTVVIPSRSGYGRSTPLDHFPEDFHYRAMLETLEVLTQLDLEDVIWWGHSDGAVVAAMAAIHAPDRVGAAIFEALHLYADKPGSKSFFQRMATDPDSFGDKISRILAAEHGENRWRDVLHLDGQMWLELAKNSVSSNTDLFQGRLHQVACPTLILHGALDPRSEPGELNAIRDSLAQAKLVTYEDAGHSPHSERNSKESVIRDVTEFLAAL